MSVLFTVLDADRPTGDSQHVHFPACSLGSSPRQKLNENNVCVRMFFVVVFRSRNGAFRAAATTASFPPHGESKGESLACQIEGQSQGRSHRFAGSPGHFEGQHGCSSSGAGSKYLLPRRRFANGRQRGGGTIGVECVNGYTPTPAEKAGCSSTPGATVAQATARHPQEEVGQEQKEENSLPQARSTIA